MQEKQLLSRLNIAEQRIVDLYHKYRNFGGIAVNGTGPINSLYIYGLGDILTNTVYTENSAAINLSYNSPQLPYKVYRAKIAMQTVDWPGYGYLYNWYAVTDARKLENPDGGTGLTAPNEWRVPSDTDWNTLATFASGSSVAGGKLKSTLNSTAYPFYGWLNNSGGTDDYNFNALPGGLRFPMGNFSGIGEYVQFWTSTSTAYPFNGWLNNGGTDDYNFGGLGGGFRETNGSFTAIGNVGYWWTSTSAGACCAFNYLMSNLGISLDNFPDQKTVGKSVRLVREATAGELLLNDGDTSDTSSLDPYTGNDGKIYVTVKIDTQIWLAQNLRETKYNDNSDIFNASALFGGDFFNGTWEAKGIAQEGAWTAYRFSDQQVEYNPTSLKLFYNDVLENTLDVFPGQPLWVANSDANGPFYNLNKNGWNKTHIKITPGYDVSDFPTINERSLLIERAVEGEAIIIFRPIKKDGTTGTITIEDLNNYNDVQGVDTSYVYVEILEYESSDYYSQTVGIGLSNL